MIANNIKKKVLDDWAIDFQGLSTYAQNKLYKVLGTFVIGIEIFKLPRTDEYRPYFVLYPLWKSSVGECLDEPIILQEIYSKSGRQYNIPYVEHDTFFREAIECMREQSSISFDGNVTLPNVLGVINKQFSQILVKASPVGKAKLFEGKLCAALYVNDENNIRKIFEDLEVSSKSWTPDLFEWKFGNLDTWIQNLYAIVAKRDEFMKQVELNKQDKKISRLKSSDITA